MNPSAGLGMLLLVLVSVCGCATPVAQPAPDNQRYYHDGERRVRVHVLLDRLQVDRGSADDHISTHEVVLLRTPVASVAALEAIAREMRAAQPDIRAMSAFIEEQGPTGAQRTRLTHQVAVRWVAGTDMVQVAVQHGAQLVRTFTEPPDTGIVESGSPALLAALTLAESLRTAPGVAVAIPLSE